MILRRFLDACLRHQWMPGLTAQATLYIDELPPRPQSLPRFIPEYVMAQLEDEQNLAHLPDATTRHLLILIQETGLRAAEPIRAQQDHLRQRWPGGVPVLFPSPHANRDGLRSFAYATFSTCLTCPDFQTTPVHLPIHRRQVDDTLELIILADKRETPGSPPTTAWWPPTSVT